MKYTFVDACASYLETYVITPPPASVINGHMGEGFFEANDNVNDVIEAFLSDHPEWVIETFEPVSRELNGFEIESTEPVTAKETLSLSVPLASKPDQTSGLLTVELLVSYQEQFVLPRITKTMVVDADIEWEAGCGDEAIQEYLDQNWDDHQSEAILRSSERSDVEFHDVSGFDPYIFGERKLFTFKVECVALEDYTRQTPPLSEVKAGDTWTLWPNLFGHLCREDDPTLFIASRDSRLKTQRRIDELQRQDKSFWGNQAPKVSVSYQLIPSPEQIRFETNRVEVGVS